MTPRSTRLPLPTPPFPSSRLLHPDTSMLSWVLLPQRLSLTDCKCMSNGALLLREHPCRGLLPLPSGYLLRGDGANGELPVPDVPSWKLLPGGLHFSDEVLDGNVPDGHGRDRRQCVSGLRARMGVRFGRNVFDDYKVGSEVLRMEKIRRFELEHMLSTGKPV